MLSKERAMRLVGPISSGTLRAEDLGSAFSSLLDTIGDDLACVSTLDAPEVTEAKKRWNGRKDDLLAEWEQECAKDDHDPDEVGDIVNEMQQLINESLPEGFEFGSQEGDGACFGVWQTDDAGSV